MTVNSSHDAAAAIPMGAHARIERVVPHEWTLSFFDPRLPPVLSTPSMIGMMEVAASQAVLPHLRPGEITVGTRIEVDHLKAVPSGAHVIATACLATRDGRFLVFEVEARSGDHLIGRGRVFRAVVQSANFAAQASKRAKP